MPHPSRHRRLADEPHEPHVLPLRPAASDAPLADLVASLVAELTSERCDRGLPPIDITLDTAAGRIAAGDAGPLSELLRALLEAACEAAAAAPPRLREVVVTSVAGPTGLEIEVADSGPQPAADPGSAVAAVRPLAERLGGTLAYRGCPAGGAAITLHLPRRGRRQQAA